MDNKIQTLFFEISTWNSEILHDAIRSHVIIYRKLVFAWKISNLERELMKNT